MTSPVAQPFVSVVMLVHNREELVGRALRGVLEQSYTAFEFVVIDNGSIDGSARVVASISQHDKRVTTKRIEETTIGSARNIGVELSRGTFVTFVDDDDVVAPTLLECLVRLIHKSDADISLCGSLINESGLLKPNYVFDETLVLSPEQATVELLKRERFNTAMPSKLIRRRLLREFPFNEDSLYDDIWTGYKLFANSRKTIVRGIPLYTFTRHQGNNSAFTTDDSLLTEEQLLEYMRAFRERTEYLSCRLPSIADWAFYSELSYMISMVNKIIASDLEHCARVLEMLKKSLRSQREWLATCPYVKDFEYEILRMYIEPADTEALDP